MPMYVIGYLYEPTPGAFAIGVSYRGGPTMNEDEARGVVVGKLMKEFPNAKLCSITLLEIDPADIQQAASWYQPEAKEEAHG